MVLTQPYFSLTKQATYFYFKFIKAEKLDINFKIKEKVRQRSKDVLKPIMTDKPPEPQILLNVICCNYN